MIIDFFLDTLLLFPFSFPIEATNFSSLNEFLIWALLAWILLLVLVNCLEMLENPALEWALTEPCIIDPVLEWWSWSS